MSQVVGTTNEQPELRMIAPNATEPATRRGPSGHSRTPGSRIAPRAAAMPEDPWIYRIVVAALGLVLLITALGGVMIASGATEAKSTELLIALASGSVGALAGLLSPTGAR